MRPPAILWIVQYWTAISRSQSNIQKKERNSRRVMNLKGLWLLARDAFFQFIDDNPFQMGAALAYYTLFSLAPLLLIAIAVAGSLFGREAPKIRSSVRFRTSLDFRARGQSRR